MRILGKEQKDKGGEAKWCRFKSHFDKKEIIRIIISTLTYTEQIDVCYMYRRHLKLC